MIIKNALIADGNRSELKKGSVYIKGNKIDKIIYSDHLKEIDSSKDKVIDASGYILAPGFIDIHSHSDSSYILQNNPDSKIFQGITSEVVGSCGISPYPNNLDDYLYMHSYQMYKEDIKPYKSICDDFSNYKAEMDKLELMNNLYSLVGHGSIRAKVMGFKDDNPTEEELMKMCNLLEKQLVQGAIGISLGLIYPPGIFAHKSELIELGKVISKHNKIITVHMRNEGENILESLKEMIEVGRESGAKIQISHLKLLGKKMWGKSKEMLELIEQAREEGIRITGDQYPYLATCTSLLAVIPKWANVGGFEKLMERLRNPDSRLIDDIIRESENRGGFESIVVSNSKAPNQEFNGKSIFEISQRLGIEPVEALLKIAIDSDTDAEINYFSIDKEDIFNIMKKIYISIGSDGSAYNTEILEGNPHPRNFASFPQFIEYVRENDLMPIEDAIYKMTKLNAEILNIKDRGEIKVGNIADLTVIDWNNTYANSNFENPIKRAEGIKHLIVNGILVINNEILTDNKVGKVIVS